MYAVKGANRVTNRLMLTGNDAIASSALISGCKFMASYPMSPSTPIQLFFASKMKDYQVVFEQAEDEISAINMALGAQFAGVRSMVATSGGGFSLMVEGLSLAGMTETPVVIVICERPGPATGFPTRTEQAELEFVIHAGHGEFPRAVFAPGTPEQAFQLTSKAFNLADKYQIPVMILSDQHFSDTYFTTERFDTSLITMDRGEFFSQSDSERFGEYKRHMITDSGISPRMMPGQSWGLVVTDSDEHTEDGHLTELAEARIANVNKRLRKFELLKGEIQPPYVYGPTDANIVLMGWGSTYGALKEAAEILNGQGLKVGMLHFSELWPFPGENVAEQLKRYETTICVENNATGQMAHLIRSETGIEMSSKILRFDGRPLTPQYIVRKFESIR
jgi:2-oxoglutarate ferredoxin oxidoreductase subunit alpha